MIVVSDATKRVLSVFASAPRYDTFFRLFRSAGENVAQATCLLRRSSPTGRTTDRGSGSS